MKTFLIGVDGSAESKAAADFASEMARACGGKVVLAFCVPPIAALEGAAVGGYFEAQRKFGEQLLREMEARCARPGVAVERLLLDGNPASRLAEVARERNADLVVVGHRGRGAVRRVLLGSVADRLAQTSPKPVLIVR